MGNYHVPFWRAVEEATPSLTLIIKNRGAQGLKAQLMSSQRSPPEALTHPKGE